MRCYINRAKIKRKVTGRKLCLCQHWGKNEHKLFLDQVWSKQEQTRMEPFISPVQNSTHRCSPDNQGCQRKHWQPDGGDDLPCGGKDNWPQKGASEEPTRAPFRKMVTLNICQAQLVTEANLKGPITNGHTSFPNPSPEASAAGRSGIRPSTPTPHKL